MKELREAVSDRGGGAPILLVMLRLIQGFAVGAELSGASAMIIENSPFGRPSTACTSCHRSADR